MFFKGFASKIKAFVSDGLFSGAVTLTASVFVVKLLGYVYKVPLSFILGDVGMGYFNSAYAVFSFFFLLCTGGIPKAVSIVTAELSQTKLPRESYDAIKAILRLFILIGAILSLGMLFGSGPLARLIGNSGAVYSIMCIAPSLLFVAAGGVARGYLAGVGALVPVAISQVMEGVIKFVFGLVFALAAVAISGDIKIVSAATVVGVTMGVAISNIYLLLCIKKKNKVEKIEQNIKIYVDKKKVLKRIIAVAAPVTLSSAVMGLSGIIDLGLIMQRLRGLGMTEESAGALYGNYTTLAIPMLNLVVALLSPITVAALPLFTAKFSGGDKIGLTKRAESVFSVTLFFAAPVGLCFALFSEQILSLLFNDTSAAIAAPQLMLLSPAIVFLPLVTVLNTVLEATGKPHLPLFALTLGAAVKFVVSFFLLGNVDFGIAGAPIGTSVGYGFSLIISYAFSSWISGVDCINMRKCIKIIMVSLTSVFGAKGVFILISKEISALPGLMISMIILAVIYVVLSMLVKIFATFGGKISAK